VRVHLQGLAAWAPGLEDEKDWRRLGAEGGPILHEGTPDVRFLPALLRRRCDLLSRMMLLAAHRCADRAKLDLSGVRTVFASRHGSFSTAISLLENVAEEETPSPAQFSHSVHNAQAGLFSIWAKNRAPSVALAAGAETFVAGLLEAIAQLRRGAPVLLVAGDETIPEAVAPISDHAPPPHAVALLLADRPPGAAFALEIGTVEPADAATPEDSAAGQPATPAPDGLPDALAFVGWWLSDRTRLRLVHPPRSWNFERG